MCQCTNVGNYMGNTMKKCIIVGAGDFFGLSVFPEKGDLVIAADGGYDYLKKAGIDPDLVVGDFDSRDGQIPVHPGVIRLEIQKDDTDIAHSIGIGLEKGYRDFRIFGGTGGRESHTIANIQALTGLSEKGASGWLYGKDNVMTVIHDGEVIIPAGKEGMVSVFSLSDSSQGVTIAGMKYTMSDGVMTNNITLGVSNMLIGEEAVISVKKGTLLVIHEYKEREWSGRKQS